MIDVKLNVISISNLPYQQMSRHWQSKTYSRLLLLNLQEVRFNRHIFEFNLNKTIFWIYFLDLNQLEDGEVDADDSQDVESRQGSEAARRRFQRDPFRDPSKRDKMFTLEKISNQQMIYLMVLKLMFISNISILFSILNFRFRKISILKWKIEKKIRKKTSKLKFRNRIFNFDKLQFR